MTWVQHPDELLWGQFESKFNAKCHAHDRQKQSFAGLTARDPGAVLLAWQGEPRPGIANLEDSNEGKQESFDGFLVGRYEFGTFSTAVADEGIVHARVGPREKVAPVYVKHYAFAW